MRVTTLGVVLFAVGTLVITLQTVASQQCVRAASAALETRTGLPGKTVRQAIAAADHDWSPFCEASLRLARETSRRLTKWAFVVQKLIYVSIIEQIVNRVLSNNTKLGRH